MSTGLWTQVLMTQTHPRTGELTTRLTNIVSAEPDAALFEVPHGYNIVDVQSGYSFAFGPMVEPSRQPAIQPPAVISRIEPQYTEEARAARINGSVQLKVLVGANGTPRDIRIARSLDAGLDGKAIDAVKQWRFRPAMQDGMPVPYEVTIEISFNVR